MGKFYDFLNNIINKINTNTSSISSINNSMSEMQTEIDKKENKLTDAVSGVPVVFNAANNSNLHITTNATKIAHSGKNMLPYPYIDTTGTKGGITYTDNGDGSITINGTATTTSYFNLCSDIYFGDRTIIDT